MNPTFTLAQYDEAADFIRGQTQHRPTVGLVLGSGLGPFADQIADAQRFPYATIPHFPLSTVAGHVGQLVIGQLAGAKVCVMQGRFHFYEGYTLAQVTFPIRVMQRLGIRTLILTNAAGGVNPAFAVGDLMLIEDHINFVGMGGNNPLLGPNLDAFGARFPPMNKAYTRHLRDLAAAVGEQNKLLLRRGVYLYVAGPNFETPAEIRMMRLLGCDVVGMTGAQEVVLARELGMTVGAVALSINWAAGIQRSLEIVYDGLPALREKVLALSVAVLRATTDDDCEPAKLH
ncbi:MAG: purine-nucleoside phosphorylase [Anaerolineales bacterium]|nr:purine-nucleoside phosphorylase [Anaerolineales bacterium]